ncbi:MAG: hypothetical protein J7576_02220, partial [Siphonobacter aquaeclarae]|nr:hypothetical protein [Siphonobacter aquaeclarae]
HILKKPATSYLFIPNVTAKIASIQTYEGKKPLKFKQQPEGLFVYLDGVSTDNWDTILEVRTK